MTNINIKVCSDADSFALEVDRLISDAPSAALSPIDEYYNFTKTFFPTATSMLTSPIHSNIAVLGLISAVELYVRHIASRCIKICPKSESRADLSEIKIGSIKYYGDNIGRAINESDSLANSKNIIDYINKTIGMKIRDQDSPAFALREFEKLCKMRHAAVHSRGYLSYSNAREIGLVSLESEKAIQLDPLTYQDAYKVCNNVVRSINSYVFEMMVERWVFESTLIGNWSADKSKWLDLIGTFYSTIDNKEQNKTAYILYQRISRRAAARYAARSNN